MQQSRAVHNQQRPTGLMSSAQQKTKMVAILFHLGVMVVGVKWQMWVYLAYIWPMGLHFKNWPSTRTTTTTATTQNACAGRPQCLVTPCRNCDITFLSYLLAANMEGSTSYTCAALFYFVTHCRAYDVQVHRFVLHHFHCRESLSAVFRWTFSGPFVGWSD